MQNTINRREFTLQTALAMLSGVAITVSGCGSVTPVSPSPTPGASGAVSGSISANHGHTAVISHAQLTGGGSLALDIRGSSEHSHTITLSQSDLASISAGQRVSVQSTNDTGHSHTVTFN